MLPWTEWLAHACFTLRITPEAFWRLSLREWSALTGMAAAAPLTRQHFAALASRFPD